MALSSAKIVSEELSLPLMRYGMGLRPVGMRPEHNVSVLLSFRLDSTLLNYFLNRKFGAFVACADIYPRSLGVLRGYDHIYAHYRQLFFV